MPKLPQGLKPRHIHVIDCISEIRKKNDTVCVSDVSSTLNITTPSVTKLINELEEKNIINKNVSNGDKRSVSLSLTDLGESYYKYYVLDYHNKISNELKNLNVQDCITTIETIEKLYTAINDIEMEELLNE